MPNYDPTQDTPRDITNESVTALTIQGYDSALTGDEQLIVITVNSLLAKALATVNQNNLSGIVNDATARENIKAVGNDPTGYPGATAIGLILGISQQNFDLLPSSAQNDPNIAWIIS